MLGAALGAAANAADPSAAVCRAQAGWDLACLRARYAAPRAQWPAPSIDPGVAWTEWAPVPAASAPALQWTAANAGQAQLAADVATPAIVALGQTLFFDARLSRKGRYPVRPAMRPNAPSPTAGRWRWARTAHGTAALHAAVRRALRAPALLGRTRRHAQEQVMGPLHDPREMNHDAAGAVARLDASESYPARFLRAFGAAPAQGSPPGAVPMSSVPNPPLDAISVAPVPGSPIDADRLARALAAYVATLRPERTRFDDFIEGRADALDDTELLGLHLFRTGPAA